MAHYFGRMPLVEATKKSELDQYYTFAREQVNWSGFRLNHLTPLHYLGEWHQTDSGCIQRLLHQNVLHLFILYTANRSTQADSYTECIFSSTEQVITMRLGTSGLKDRQVEYLPGIVSWIVSGQGTDRLVVLRSVVAREVDEDNPATNYERFVERLRQLYGEVRWHYQVFVDGKIDRHFQELEKVADDTTKISTQVSDSIDAVTKGLTDALLATIGAVVASFLAALIENKTQGSVFFIAMRAYAFYLGFYVLYRMSSTLWSYLLLNDEAKGRFRSYSERLGEDRVNNLRAPLSRRQHQFWSWFIITSVLYIALAIGVWLASTWVPQELVQRGIIVTTPTATAMPPTPAVSAATSTAVAPGPTIQSTTVPGTTPIP